MVVRGTMPAGEDERVCRIEAHARALVDLWGDADAVGKHLHQLLRRGAILSPIVALALLDAVRDTL